MIETENEIHGKQTESHPAEAQKIIQDHVIWSMGAGLLPIPMMDVAAVSAIQMDMVKKITSLYNQEFSNLQAKAWVSTLAGSLGARFAAESLKFIPGYGSLIGGVTMSLLSGATTYAIGKVFCRHFENGGTFMNFDPTKFKNYFLEQFQIGKDYAARFTDKIKPGNKTKPEKCDPQDEIQLKLKQLLELKELGIITDAEYQEFKDKLISQI